MNIRKHLEEMGARAAMYAVTREGFLMQVMTLLEVLDIDADDLLYIGGDRNSVSTEATREPILIDDPWALEVVQAALALLPPGTGEFTFTQVEAPAACPAVDANGAPCVRSSDHHKKAEPHKNAEGVEWVG